MKLVRSAKLKRLIALSLFLSCVQARSWSSTDLPSPQNDPNGVCGRGGKKSIVCDPDGLLSESDADTVDGLANFIEEGSHGFHKVPCSSGEPVGAQIAVAIFDSMSFGWGDKEDRAFKFARDLHDRWGVGNAKCQNGVVIVLAVKDRAMGFSIGAGVNRIFKDSMLPSVMNSMKPKLRSGQYGEALVVGVTAVGNILSGNKVVEEDDGSGLIAIPFVVLVLSCMGCGSCVSRRKRNRYNKCKEMLKKIDNDRMRASNNAFVATSCPICLEDFPKEGGNQDAVNAEGQANRASAADNVALDLSETKSAESVRTVTAGLGTSSREQTTSSAEDKRAEEVRILPCGHKFHDDCIVRWFAGNQQTNQLCPICRQPIIEAPGSTIESRTNNGQPSGWDVYDPEYSFRVQRAHYYYPDYITWSMINSWERDRYRHQTSMASSAAFRAVDPVVVAAAARSSGGGGSSFSFGGGSSAGGGGGGGGW